MQSGPSSHEYYDGKNQNNCSKLKLVLLMAIIINFVSFRKFSLSLFVVLPARNLFTATALFPIFLTYNFFLYIYHLVDMCQFTYAVDTHTKVSEES